MESIKELYRIGYGLSSSHTMGPRYAAQRFLGDFPHASHYEADLFGSLAATGKGHLTDSTCAPYSGMLARTCTSIGSPSSSRLIIRTHSPSGLSTRRATSLPSGPITASEEERWSRREISPHRANRCIRST